MQEHLREYMVGSMYQRQGGWNLKLRAGRFELSHGMAVRKVILSTGKPSFMYLGGDSV